MRGDYYEETAVGWVLHSQIVKIRRSVGQYARWNKRRILMEWLKGCEKANSKRACYAKKNRREKCTFSR